MRNLTIVFVAALGLVACGGQGNLQSVNLTGPARVTGAAGTECVSTSLRGMGYEVASGQSAGAITGVRRNTVSWYLRPLGYRPTIDQIDVRMEGAQLRVTAVTSTSLAEGATTSSEASEIARANAEQVLRECGSR